MTKLAIHMYHADTGRWPERLENLFQRSPRARGWGGPYLRGQLEDLRDSWGRALVYHPPRIASEDYLLFSLGPDGQLDTERTDSPDDIDTRN